VVATDSNGCNGGFDAPSPSPDGTKIVYLNGGFWIRTLATNADTLLAVGGGAPRWSPTGEWIAYDSIGFLKIVHPDGTGAHSLRNAGYLLGKVDWSPDGQWLVYRGPTELELINVVSGLVLPLAVTLNMNDPAWRP
jgi:Tol biopolymer transport system component